MESLNEDVLSLILERVSHGEDRKTCAKVSTQWFTIEALTRTRIHVRDPERLPYFLPRFPNLTAFESHLWISDQALMFVAECCPNLRTLDLHSKYPNLWMDFGNDGLAAVAKGCRHLVKISLSSRNIGDDGIAALQTYAKALAVLDLSFCHSITDASLAAIGDMDSITELCLRECLYITDSGLESLSSGPASRSLRVLTVRDCQQITDVGVLHLRRMSRLEELDLPGSYELTDVGGVAISAISSLKKLDLSWEQYVTDETLFAVARGCRNLVDISLVGCRGITGGGLVSLASSLPLERINMSTLRGCRELSSYHVVQIVKRCRSLKHIIVDMELKKGASHSQMKKLDGLCRVEWVSKYGY